MSPCICIKTKWIFLRSP